MPQAAIPAWVAWTGFGLSVAAGAYSAYSQQQAGRYQAAVAAQNARFGRAAAKDVLARGETEANEQRARTRRLIGSQRAALAASGLEISEGTSALDLLTDTAALGELDALTIKNNAAREAWGLRVGAYDYASQARLARLTGRQGFYGTILGTAGRGLYGAYDIGRGTSSGA